MDKPAAQLKAIWIKRFKYGPMDFTQRAFLIPGRGLDGNADQGGKRQVTIILQELWEEMLEELGVRLAPASRRANLLISGLSLENIHQRILCIGPCQILIWGESKPCERMDEVYPGLRKAMQKNMRGGIYGEVIKGGEITLGDAVYWANEGLIPKISAIYG